MPLRSQITLIGVGVFCWCGGMPVPAYAAAAPGASSMDPPSAPMAALVPSIDGPVDIFDIAIFGNTLLSEAEIGEAVDPFLGPGKPSEAIESVRAALAALYIKHGYNAVGVAADPQVRDGIVRMLVVEQKIARLRVVGADYTTIDEVKREAPALAEGKVPDFRAVAEELRALNQPHRTVTPVVRNGREPNTIEVDLQVKDEFPVQARIELNNRSSAGTEPLRVMAIASYDNLFQRGHVLSLNYVTAPQNPSDTQVFGGSYAAPVEGRDVSLELSGLSSSSNVAALESTTVLGVGYQVGLAAIWNLPPDGNFSGTVRAGLTYKDFREDIVTSEISLPTPVHYLPFKLSFQGTYLEPDAVNRGSVSLVENVRAASADRAEFDNKRFNARANFTILQAEYDREQKLFDDYSLYGALDLQIADGALFNTESFAIGGYDSVRGYRESEIVADDGVRGSIEFRGSNMAPMFRSPFDLLTNFRLIGFVDAAAGSIHDALPAQKSRFAIVSTGIGARITFGQNVFGAFDAAWPLVKSDQTRAGDVRGTFRMWAQYP